MITPAHVVRASTLSSYPPRPPLRTRSSEPTPPHIELSPSLPPRVSDQQAQSLVDRATLLRLPIQLLLMLHLLRSRHYVRRKLEMVLRGSPWWMEYCLRWRVSLDGSSLQRSSSLAMLICTHNRILCFFPFSFGMGLSSRASVFVLVVRVRSAIASNREERSHFDHARKNRNDLSLPPHFSKQDEFYQQHYAQPHRLA